MKVSVKDLSVDMETKNSGIELDVYRPGRKRTSRRSLRHKERTDLVQGRKRKQNGVPISWDEFMKWAEER